MFPVVLSAHSSPVTDNLVLTQLKRETMADAKVDLGTASIQADTLPTMQPPSNRVENMKHMFYFYTSTVIPYSAFLIMLNSTKHEINPVNMPSCFCISSVKILLIRAIAIKMLKSSLKFTFI